RAAQVDERALVAGVGKLNATGINFFASRKGIRRTNFVGQQTAVADLAARLVVAARSTVGGVKVTNRAGEDGGQRGSIVRTLLRRDVRVLHGENVAHPASAREQRKQRRTARNRECISRSTQPAIKRSDRSVLHRRVPHG